MLLGYLQVEFIICRFIRAQMARRHDRALAPRGREPVSAPQQSSVRNQILTALPAEDFVALQAHLEPVELEMRKVLIEPDQPIEHVYFPDSGYASVVTGTGGAKVEIGIIGREGMVGVPVALGVKQTPFEFFIQGPGHGWRVPAHELEPLVESRSGLRRRLLHYAQALNVQSSRTAFINAEYPLEARLARWLLMCHDRVDGNDFAITHEFMAMMLGVRRPGVTGALHLLEGNRLIRATRGLITIRDRKKLEEFADDAYGLPEREYARLMAEE
jgi:CRP-like cAMP-binding protein